jgi:tRNA modification GTPase
MADLGTDGPGLAVSAVTGEGLEELRTTLGRFARESLAGAADALVTRERHRRVLTTALAALERLQAELTAPVEVLAEELRVAIHALEGLAGRVDVEDVLGEIFGRFCIGK